MQSHQTLILLALVLLYSLSSFVRAQFATSDAQYCYLPTASNVNYQDVIELPTLSPEQVLNYANDPLQFGELWLPPNLGSDEKPPLLILIHGGCWLNAFDIKHTHALSTGLAHAGYAVWSIEYRRTGDAGGGWPGSFNDVTAALEFVLYDSDNDAFNNVNRSRTAIVGHSAGGHLALLAGSKFRNNPNLKAVIGLAAITDVELYAKGNNSCQQATPGFFGGSPLDKPKAYEAANPVNQMMHDTTILMTGDRDTIVAQDQAERLPNVTKVSIDGAGHFDMVHPGTPSFRALLKQLAQHL